MVVLVVFLAVRKLAWYARCPDDNGLPVLVVPEQFWSPDVDGSGIRHHLYVTLLAPVFQVFRRGIAKASVATPGTGPNQMERAIGCTDNTGVAHNTLLSHLGFKPGARNGVPMPTVVAINEP